MIVGLQPTAWPSGPGVTGTSKSRRRDSNPLRPRYEGGARPVEHRRHQEQPVLVSNQLDRGSEPQSPAESLAKSRSCRSRTCQPGFVDPALEIRETTRSTPCQSRTGQPAFGRHGPLLAHSGGQTLLGQI